MNMNRFLLQLKPLSSNLRTFCQTSSCLTASAAEKTKSLLYNAKKRKVPKIKSQAKSYKIFCQVLGSGAEGSSPSLYVYLGNRGSIFFNCAEGTFRSHREAIPKANPHSVFITNDQWENVSGISGLRQDHNLKRLTTYGPSGIAAMWSNFSQLDNTFMPLNHRNAGTESILIDDLLTVLPIQIYKRDNNENYRSGEHDLNYESTYAYICSIPEEQGSVSINLLVEAGVPPGEMVALLKAGKSVSLKDGRIVHPANVSPCYLGSLFIVIEVPSLNHLESLLKLNSFEKYYYENNQHQEGSNNSTDENQTIKCTYNPDVIFHFCSPEVMEDPRYINWVNLFSPKTSHIVINKNNTAVGIDRLNEQQVLMNHLLPDVFPLLKTNLLFDYEKVKDKNTINNEYTNQKELNDRNIEINYENRDIEKLVGSDNCESGNENDEKLHKDSYLAIHKDAKLTSIEETGLIGPVYHADPSFRIFLRRAKEIKASQSPIDDFHWVIKEYYKNEEFVDSLNEMNKKFEQLRSEEDFKNSSMEKYPQVSFLGTGSASTCLKRNVAGILLACGPNCNVILDAGESTFSQLVILEGIEAAREILVNTRAIYVSHHHFDHHFGILTLIRERKKAFEAKNLKFTKLYLLSPPRIAPYLRTFHSTFHPILEDLVIVNNLRLVKGKKVFAVEKFEEICQDLDMADILVDFVPHCMDSYAISFVSNSGWKIVYSGDTQPTGSIVKMGRDCDLLIHEATFADIMEADAREKYHSTISQAISIGNQMNAKNIILNHFSQRYSSLPVIDGDLPSNVGLAFDFMKVSLHDLRFLPHLYPVLKSLFWKEYEEHYSVSRRRELMPQYKWKRAATELNLRDKS